MYVSLFLFLFSESIAIAGSAIRHLTRIGVITTDIDSSCCSDKDRLRHRRQQFKNEDAPLVLSKRAQDRAYFPEGILDHHHAIQFITFSPPFESDDVDDTPIYAKPPAPANFSPFHNASNKSVSESHYDSDSSLLGSNNNAKRNLGSLTLGIRRVIAGSLSRREKSSQSFGKRDRSTKNSNNEQIANLITRNDCIAMKATNHLFDPEEKELEDDAKMKFTEERQYLDTSCGPNGCFSKFNCLRNLNSDSATKRRKARVSVKTKTSPQTSMASFSEEDGKRWLAYSIKPIDEDHSLTSGSIVSMSAPLLSPLSSRLLDVNTET